MLHELFAFIAQCVGAVLFVLLIVDCYIRARSLRRRRRGAVQATAQHPSTST